MSDNSSIEWTDATWNPVTGCTKVSAGCDRCYAETFAERWRGTPGHYFENGFDVQLRPDKLELPLRWRKPRRVFVNSMSDLFHKDVSDEYIARVFGVMGLAKQHTFQVLTKRHGRMRSLLLSEQFKRWTYSAMCDHSGLNWTSPEQWPLPNVWLGVSVEDQERADLRVRALLDTPAARHFLSCEPLLGPVRLTAWLDPSLLCLSGCADLPTGSRTTCSVACRQLGGTMGTIDWVIAGGESGDGHRPLDLDWVRLLRDECVATDVPFLFKQVGGRTSKAGGRELDSRTWDEYPAVAS